VQVPLSAIDDEGKGPGIWLIDSNLQVHYRPVQVTGFGEEVAILGGGAQVGERIVAVGGHYLHDAERVRLVSTQVAMQ
jgi:multidrug efflux pump subunit AcrA (membrane-fusion protein)